MRIKQKVLAYDLIWTNAQSKLRDMGGEADAPRTPPVATAFSSAI